MTYKHIADTSPESVFPIVVDELGGNSVMRAIIDETQHEIARGNVGVTLGNADETVRVSTDARGISFCLYEMGPYIVSLDVARSLMEDGAASPDTSPSGE